MPTAAQPVEYVQGDKASELIQFCMRRREAYYTAPVNLRWWDLCMAIEAAIDMRHTPEEEDLTRSKYYLASVLVGDKALNETYADGLQSADPLFAFSTKRIGTQEITEKAEALMSNVWEEGEGLASAQALLRDVNRFGMGVGYVRWDRREGEAPAIDQQSHPWGTLATVAMKRSTLLNRAIIERVHPRDWWGYWMAADNLPWEGVSREWGGGEFIGLLDDEDYDRDGVEAALERMHRGGEGGEDSPLPLDSDSEGEVPDSESLMVHEYWGTLYGCKGYEKERGEYQVIFTDREVLMYPRKNAIAGFRPIKRVRGDPMNDWPGGRPPLAPQVPNVRLQNFTVNSGVDELVDRIYSGTAVWEESLANADEYFNPEGIGGIVRMHKDAPVERIPRRINDGQSGVIADIERFNKSILESDRQSTSFQDVMSQKGGLQDGTARAANIIASQGARQVKAILGNAFDTGLKPLAEAMLLLTILNNSPEDMATQMRNGDSFELTPDDFAYLLQRNLWDQSDSFRRDPFMDAQAFERFAKIGGVEFMNNHASDPLTIAKFWRAYARRNNMPDYDEYVPLKIKPPAPPAQAPGSQSQVPAAMPPSGGAEAAPAEMAVAA